MGAKKSIRVLLVDDSKLVLKTLTNLLQSNNHIEVVNGLSDGFDVIPFLNKNDIDVIILDINLKIMNGLKVIKLVKEQFPLVEVIGFSCYDDSLNKNSILEHGASTFLSKYSTTLKLLINKIEEVHYSNVA